ncbi:hypothetical protein [Variovorax paradoxus]|uniref:hypothetical protein n=1 Tax=Variovorax paradoxus TaxID=34073 RepID=UPI0019316E62|nr:hypothetical protein INQ48_13810 [Variovorax paradoxus]
MDDQTKREIDDLRRFARSLMARQNATEAVLHHLISKLPDREGIYRLLPTLLEQFDASSLNQPIEDAQLAVMRETFNRLLTRPSDLD